MYSPGSRVSEGAEEAQDIAGAPGPQLCVADLSSLLRVVGDLPLNNPGPLEYRRRLLDGLTRIIRADTWIWAWSPDELGNVAVVEHGHLTSEESALLPRVLEGKNPATPLVRGIRALARVGRATTATLRTLLPTPATGNPVDDAHALVPLGGSGEVLISWLPGSSGGYSCLWFCRRERGTTFTAREEQLVHVVFNEVAWLRGESCRPASAGNLTRRERSVLEVLCTGASYREAARTLGIAEGTIQTHVKHIYEKLGVTSKAEAVRMAYEAGFAPR